MTQKTATPPVRRRTHVMVTLPPELRDQVEQLAKTEDRSMTSICRRMVVDGLKRMKTDKATHQKGVRT